MMALVLVSYLILVDKEQHDGQNLQEENEQEEDKELWKHKERRQSHLTNRMWGNCHKWEKRRVAL